ncbi:MAG TPA: TPM domain-containing protein [Kofleriaceae bacterium]|nr:TPM domain-containing protein [Kofleriaceae bacterium]
MMVALLAFVFSIVGVTEVPNPRPNGWVTDQANVLDATTEARLNTLAETLYRTKQIELAVVTVDDVRGSPKQFATSLFAHWKIGNAQTNTGVLVLLVMGKRRLEIETGTGIEGALPADWLAKMQAGEMVPRFKQKDFPGGLVAGVQAIADHLGAAPGESTSTVQPGEYRDDNGVVPPSSSTPAPARQAVPVLPPRPAYTTAPADDGLPVGPLAAGGAGLLGLGGGAALLARHRRRRRTCMKCQPHRAMLPLSEVEDDQHLDAGERTEEQLGSVNYEVVICPGCQDARTLRHAKWFSSYSRCGSCNFKTLASSSTTIATATYDHGGQVRVTEDCKHCKHHTSYMRYTSKRTRPSPTSTSSSTARSSFSSSSSSSSSRSSSRGGSFGGGSSRGGGAGSSW